jgi:hypothetical protein
MGFDPNTEVFRNDASIVRMDEIQIGDILFSLDSIPVQLVYHFHHIFAYFQNC